jgi:hypothetical protein
MSKEEQTKSGDIYEELFARRKRRQEELKEAIENANEMAMLVDGHDDALAGYDTQGRAIYFVDAIIGTLMQRDGMTQDEATEFFDFNIAGAYVGEYTPIYMYEE